MVSRLPPDSVRPRLPQEILDGFKRERTSRALSAAVHEEGLHRLSVAEITMRAKIARNTFYELFGSRQEAVAYAIGLGNDRLRSAIDHGAMGGNSWEARVAAVIAALLEAVASEPYLAELYLVHAPGAEGVEAPLDPGLVQSLAGVLRPIRREGGSLPGPRTEELIAYAILGLIAERLRRDEADSLEALGPELVEFAVGPFVGAWS